MNNNNVIEISGLTYTTDTGKPVFSDLDFSLESGRTAIITGQTGTGKTTLTELIICTKKPVSGIITVFGKNITSPKKRIVNEIRKKIGGVGGVFEPISYKTVYENMNYPLILKGYSLARQKATILKSLAEINLLGQKNVKIANFSRGEKMLIMLTRAGIANQPLLIIDEPLAGLDPAMTESVLEILRKLSISGHSILILTSGQTRLDFPNSLKYTMANGRLI